MERNDETPLVLVVEDDAETLGWLRILLRDELGYRVATATDGRLALERAQRQRPDVAVVDFDLPDIDGYELARRVRADPRLAGCFLIALTAFGKRTAAERAGFDLFLPKPTDLDTLLEAVRGGAEGVPLRRASQRRSRRRRARRASETTSKAGLSVQSPSVQTYGRPKWTTACWPAPSA